MKFVKTHNDPNSSARCGVITTDHGQIETPIFMPVGTVGSVKGIYHRDLKEDIKESAKRAEEDAAWAKEHPVLSTISTLYRVPLTVFDYADNLIDSSKGIGRENSIYGVSNVYDDNFINRNNTNPARFNPLKPKQFSISVF